ncbi:mannosyl transferase [Stagonosporopsis vannaccii]|nr:mannosyl transferase [Stagonosporopsis vannaccii]
MNNVVSSPMTLLALGACALLLALAFIWRRQTTNYSVIKAIDLSEKEPSPPFQTPLPQPLHGYRLELTDPKAYRPFRHGANYITMGIRKMSWDEWIEMDSNFIPYHDRKVSELEKDVKAHVDYVDNDVTRLACFEVLEELTQYLTHRFPEIFRLKGNTLRNVVTNENFQYPATSPTEAMVTAAKLVQDDLALMIENDDGQYHLDAGAVCLPGFWRLKEKFRMSLDTLHIEAGVPHYQEKLQKSMNRFFKRLTPESPVIRNNFFIQLDDGLHWSHRMGDQNSDQVASWATADSTNLRVEEIHFRSERQSLRRLPKSGALLFTIRTYFEPVTVIAQEPHIPGRLAEAIRNWDETMSYYKGKKHWEDILLPHLDAMHAKQIESGVLEKSEEGAFPF